MDKEKIFRHEELLLEIKKSPLSPDFTHKGTSFEDAIVIKGTNNTQLGIIYEHVYIKEMYPAYTDKKQKLVEKNGKAYDVIEISTKDGSVSIHFDISEFYFKTIT